MTTFCLICLLVSLLIAGVFVVNWIISFKNKHGFIHLKRTSVKTFFTPFSEMVAGLFVAITILFVPIFWYGLIPTSGELSTVLKTVFLSAQNALQLFVVNADFGNVKEMISNNVLPKALADVYTVVVAIYFVIAPLLTAAVALRLVKGLYENWRYVRKRDKKLYVMSELNESSLALARDILINYAHRDEDVLTEDELNCKTDINPENGAQKRKIKRTLVFAGVTQVFQEEHPDLVAKAQGLGAICLPTDITEIGLKSPKRAMYRKLFLIGENESVNVDKAMRVIEKCYKDYNSSKTHVYVFGVADESGIVLDSCIDSVRIPKDKNGEPILEKDEDGEIKKSEFYIHVRRVDEKRNFIWKTVLRGAEELNIDEEVANSSPRDESSVHDSVPYIFSSALPERDGLRDINILIVGLGGYGRELLQTLCWFCQMPGYRLTIHAMDGDADCESKVRALSPELINPRFADSINDVIGESRYDLQFHNKPIDVNSSEFREEVMSIKDRITLAFVTLGDDKTNVDTAIKLSRFFGIMYPDDDQRPYILCTVYDSDKADHLDNGKALIRKNTDYRIRFIGGHSSRYRLENVEQPRLERMGEAVHMLWSLSTAAEVKKKEEELEEIRQNGDINAINNCKDKLAELRGKWYKAKTSYNFAEYNRLSSKARSLYMIARETMLDEISNGMTEAQKIDLIASYEHRRWNAYERAMGYVYGKKTSHFKLVHCDLVPYNDLNKDDKDKDAYVWSKLVEEVAKAENNVKNSVSIDCKE